MSIKLSDYGAVGDGITNDAPALQRMRASLLELQSQEPQHFVIEADPGHYVYTENNWLFGLKSFELNAYGSKFQCTNNDANGRAFTSLRNGDLFDTDGSNPFQSGIRRDGWLFKSAEAGSDAIELIDPAGVAELEPGVRVLLYGFAQQDAGYPPNVRAFEYGTVATVDQSMVFLTERLAHDYDDRWADASGGPPAFGKPRVLPLDRPDYTWPDLVVLRGFELLINPNKSADSWQMTGRDVVCEDLRCEVMFPSLGDTFEGTRCVVTRVCLPDKIINRTRFDNCDFQRGYGDGTSSLVGIVENCRIGINKTVADHIKPSAQQFHMRGCDLYSAPDEVFGIIKLPEGGLGQFAELSGNAFHNRSDVLKHVVNNIPERTFQIEEVDGNDLLFVRTGQSFQLTHSLMRPGWPIWEESGAKAGRITSVIEDVSGKFRVSGDWSPGPPAVGETWQLRETDQLVTANNQVLDGDRVPFIRFPLYANTLATKTVTLGRDHLAFEQGLLTFPVQGYLRSLQISVNASLSPNPLRIDIDGSISEIDLTTSGVRVITAQSSEGLGGDILMNDWASRFTSQMKLSITGAHNLPYRSMITIVCDIEGLGV